MKVLVLSIDVPFPAKTGGRVDVWRRICGLKASGAQIGLLCWYDESRDGEPTIEALNEIHRVVDTAAFFPVRRSVTLLLLRLINSLRWPSHVSSRWLAIDKNRVLEWARRFNPDVILLDGLYGGAVGVYLSNKLSIPLVYRSHNVEHVYMAQLAKISRGLVSRLGLLMNIVGLRRFEYLVLRHAVSTLDISLDDVIFWKGKGFSHVKWLPTSVDDGFVCDVALIDDKSIDLLYFGNLHTPNNVDAVRWLVDSVLPCLPHDVKLTLAGSKPSGEVLGLVQKSGGRVGLIPDPKNMAHVIGAAKVIVNPMRFGSGVNLKSVEMLFTDAGLVSTSVGVKGLPHSAKRCFEVHDEPHAFANAIELLLRKTNQPNEERLQARMEFSSSRAYHELADILSCLR